MNILQTNIRRIIMSRMLMDRMIIWMMEIQYPDDMPDF